MDLTDEAIEDKILEMNTAFKAKHFNEEIEGGKLFPESLNKEKLKTLTVALVICLHLDVDPPDIQKINPCCRKEAWYDPTGRNTFRSLDQIGQNLQEQYERWQPKARYMKCLDPTFDEVKKLCLSLRRNAKKDRVLFHYNGHGVPRPTPSSEIWVFNKTYTKYIPLSLSDLNDWMGTPSLYVFDCHRAGALIDKFKEFREKSFSLTAGSKVDSQGGDYLIDHTIILGACGGDEDLPQNPDIPADLFTSCLTTPINMSIRWYWLRNKHRYPAFLESMLPDAIPGTFTNRLSILGELNWIFTAVTDTIAWSSLPKELFQALFRQDMLVATLFRNFLLAERIGRSYDMHPVSYPPIPSTAGHSLWASWDETLDQLMDQLLNLRPALLSKKQVHSKGPTPPSITRNFLITGNFDRLRSDSDILADRFLMTDPNELPILCHPKDEPLSCQQSVSLSELLNFDECELLSLSSQTANLLKVSHSQQTPTLMNMPRSIAVTNSIPGKGQVVAGTNGAHSSGGLGTITLPSGEQIHYRSATFFCDQLRAFEVWLRTANELMPPATQLPILLQVLLSQVHRIRALELLCDYVDLGCWAVQHCLAVGIFPYIVRLLQSNINEVKPLIVFLWCKITACAETDFAKNENVRDSGYRYFTSCLDVQVQQNTQTCIMATFVLAQMLNNNPHCQDAFLKDRFLYICKAQLSENPYHLNMNHYIQLRKWLILAMSRLWKHNDMAKWAAVRNNLQDVLYEYLKDVSPVVRACTIHALHTFVDNYGPDGNLNDHAIQLNHSVGIQACHACVFDGSPLVRRELVALLSVYVIQFEAQLVSMAAQYIKDALISHAYAPSSNARASIIDSSPMPTRAPNSFVIFGNSIPTGVVSMANVYSKLWRSIILLSHDPYVPLAEKGRSLASHILEKTKEINAATGPLHIACLSADTSKGSQMDLMSPNSSIQHENSPPGIQLPIDNPILNSSIYSSQNPHRTVVTIQCGISPENEILARMSSSPNNALSNPNLRPLPLSPHPLRQGESTSPIMGSGSGSRENNSHARYLPINPISFEELKETQLFQWTAKEFMEPGCRTFHSSSSSTKNTTKSNITSTNSTNGLVSLGPMPTFTTSSLLIADRKFLWKKRQEIKMRGKEIWSNISLVPHAGHTTRITAATASSQLSSGKVGAGNSPLIGQHRHHAKTDSIESIDSPGPMNLNQYLLLKGTQTPHLLRFHPYSPHLAVAESGRITIWDLESGMPKRNLNTMTALLTLTDATDTGRFNTSVFNANWKYPPSIDYYPPTTSLEFINCHEERSLLLAGSSDGAVYIWRNYYPDLNQGEELVTAWYALNDILQSNRPAGLISHWHQNSGQLTVSGDVKVVRVWDTQQEARVLDLATGADSCVSALDRSEDGRLIFAGMGDGFVRLFDIRAPSGEMMSVGGQGECGWINSVRFSGAENAVYSIDNHGRINTWNIVDRSNGSPGINGLENNDKKSGSLPSKFSSLRPTIHPRRKALLESTEYKCIPRIGSGIYPTALALNPTSIRCCEMKVDSNDARQHLALIGCSMKTNREVLMLKMTSGGTHATYKYREGFNREMITDPTSLAFHPHKPWIGVGTSDSLITILEVKAK